MRHPDEQIRYNWPRELVIRWQMASTDKEHKFQCPPIPKSISSKLCGAAANAAAKGKGITELQRYFQWSAGQFEQMIRDHPKLLHAIASGYSKTGKGSPEDWLHLVHAFWPDAAFLRIASDEEAKMWLNGRQFLPDKVIPPITYEQHGERWRILRSFFDHGHYPEDTQALIKSIFDKANEAGESPFPELRKNDLDFLYGGEEPEKWKNRGG